MTTKKKAQKDAQGNPRMIDSRDLAALIAAALHHPDCPPELDDAINDFTHHLFNRLNEGPRKVYMTAPYIRALLIEHKAQEGGEGR